MKTIPNRFKDAIVETPTLASSRGDKSQYDDLADTLKLLDATKSVRVFIVEAQKLFGKNYKNNLRYQLRKRGIKKLRIGIKNDTIFIWENR